VSGLAPRRATPADASAVVETLTLAFANDPVWRPTLTSAETDASAMRAFWDIWVRGAMRYPWVWLLDEAAAVSVWIPPDGTELSDDQEAELMQLARHDLGDDGLALLSDVSERFEHAHPRHADHYYLSLLGTHPRWRGQGLGVGLLEANLGLIDADRAPAYLESSNPANDARYLGYGFESVVVFELPAGQRVSGMWREPAPRGAGSRSGGPTGT
jgi:GNAT superfamily N-acetyltransferase